MIDVDAFTTEAFDRIEAALEGLSASADGVDPAALRRRSVAAPVALVRTVGEAVDGAATRAHLADAAEAVGCLAAFLRVRRDLIETDRYPTRHERTLAVLASDHLLASAHGALAAGALPADRRLACYRALTDGTTDLAARLYGGATERTPVDGSGSEPGPRAVVAGTGGAVGAAAAGARPELVSAMGTYGESVATASDAPGTLLSVLSATGAADAGDGRTEPATDPSRSDRVEAHRRRARNALEALPDPGADRDSERAARRALERAVEAAARTAGADR